MKNLYPALQFDPPQTVKAEFHADARKLLRDVGRYLTRGTISRIRSNPAGPAVAGEVYADMSAGASFSLLIEVGSTVCPDGVQGRLNDGVYIQVQKRRSGRILGANIYLDPASSPQRLAGQLANLFKEEA